MNPPVPYDVKSLISPKEQVLWVERPYQWHISSKALQNFGGALLWAVGVMAVVLGWLPFPSFPPIFLLFWGVTGAINLIGTPLWNLYKRTQTTYVLTDRRIAIHRDGISGNTYSYHLNTLGNLTFQRERNGRGSISLSGDPVTFGNVNPNRNTITTAELSAVQNVAQVYELIIAAKEKSAVHEMPVLTETPAAPRRVY